MKREFDLRNEEEREAFFNYLGVLELAGLMNGLRVQVQSHGKLYGSKRTPLLRIGKRPGKKGLWIVIVHSLTLFHFKLENVERVVVRTVVSISRSRRERRLAQ